MILSQSVVLWQVRGGIQKIALFPYLVKDQIHIMARTAQIRKVHHYCKTWRSVNAELCKIFLRFFKCSCKNHQALWWNWLSWGPPQERKTQSYLCYRGSLELPASEIAAQISASQSSSNRHISTSTVQRRLGESGLHGRIAAKKPLLKYTNMKKRLAWAKKHDQWTLDQWKSVLWSDESKFEIFGSNHRVFVRRRVGERMISACDSHREAWRRRCDGVWVLCLWHYLWFI